MASAACRRLVAPPALSPAPTVTRLKFDAAFLERRMREHRQWQDRVAAELVREILAECAFALEDEAVTLPAKIVRL